MRSVPPPLGNRPWVAYIVPFPYPWGQAGSRRVDGISRSIAATGRDVLVIALPEAGAGHADPRVVVRGRGSSGTVRVVTKHPLPQRGVRRQLAHHFVGAREALALIEDSARALPTHVLFYGTVATPLGQTLRWGRTRGVPVILDVVERYSPLQFSGGLLSPGFVAATAGFDALAHRADGIIAISRYLESHFLSHNLPTLRIPPSVDLSELPVGEPAPGPMRMGYFGNPGRKDLLQVVVEAFVRARIQVGRADLQLLIGGPGTREAVHRHGHPRLDGVEFLGSVPQTDVPAVLGSLHATVLARTPARFTRAGFPTKVVESLSVGTPVVSNLTSDLADVIIDGETGWVAEGPTVAEMTTSMARAALTSHADLVEMRIRARSCAEELFDTRRHVDPMHAFLVAVAGRSG